MRGCAQRAAGSCPTPSARSLRFVAWVVLLLSGCGVEEVVLERFRGETPRERYLESLERAGLGETLMARAWDEAGKRAMWSFVDVSPPLLEEVWLSPEEPMALGYRIEARRGQRIRVELAPEEPGQIVFVELFRVRGGSGDEGSPTNLLVSWAEEEELGITYDARASASYLLRIQPELLGGGAVRVSLEVGASLAFPVEDRTTRHVGSYFGDIRDGGARDHHGVDIFAPRSTPVLAATPGTVYRVGVNRLGGNVVWVRDPTGDLRQYYAHLDTQLVQRGDEVQAGDVLGLVGNTGNAITTPPHLHFGLYLQGEGPVDPMPFLHDPGGTAPPLALAREDFGPVVRTRTEGSTLRATPSNAAMALDDLPVHLPLKVVGGAGSWFRIRLPTGEEGYLPGSAVEPTGEPVAREEVPALALRRAPTDAAPRIRETDPGELVSILGRSGSWAWVSGEGGVPGWMKMEEDD